MNAQQADRARQAAPFRERIAAYALTRPMPAAVVVDVGWVNGLAAIRSLGRAGAPVIAVDHRPSALGFRSRYALRVACPDPGLEEGAFVERLAELGDALGRPAPIFPTHDAQLNAIAKGEERLGARFLYPFPSWDVLGPGPVEALPARARRSRGRPDADHRLPGLGRGRRWRPRHDIGCPVLVKPSEPTGFKRRFRRQAFRCEGKAELEGAYADAEPFGPMLQELIPGDDDALYTFGSYLGADGTALGLFCGRKLAPDPARRRNLPCRGGALGRRGGRARRFGSCSGGRFHGISQVEFKRDPRSGQFKLMEVNPRLWQWHGLAAACGVDSRGSPTGISSAPRLAPVRMHGDGTLGDQPHAGRQRPHSSARRTWTPCSRSTIPRPGLAQRARLARASLPLIPPQIERRARWVLDTLGARNSASATTCPTGRGLVAGRAR